MTGAKRSTSFNFSKEPQMNKAIRIATAAALGVMITMPVLAEDIKAPAPGATGQPFQNESIPSRSTHMSARDAGSHHDRFYRGNTDWSMSTGTNEFGSPAGDMPSDREIRLSANGGSVNVSHGETVKFIMPGGREFRWRFDTLKNVTSFPMSSIAPDNMSGRVYVSSDNQNNAG
jgi:hypothetical protein